MNADKAPAPIAGALLTSPIIAPVLDRWSDINLPDCWLVAGGIAQTVWNAAFGFTPDHGLRDIDLIYFDPDDLTKAAEDDAAARVRAVIADLPVRLDVKNEARVHLWYEAKFGYPIAPYASVPDAIATFPTTATAICVRPGSDGLDLCAPFGCDDLMNCVVRANKAVISRAVYEAKIARWKPLWPDLTIIEWDHPPNNR